MILCSSASVGFWPTFTSMFRSSSNEIFPSLFSSKISNASWKSAVIIITSSRCYIILGIPLPNGCQFSMLHYHWLNNSGFRGPGLLYRLRLFDTACKHLTLKRRSNILVVCVRPTAQYDVKFHFHVRYLPGIVSGANKNAAHTAS